LDLFIYFFKILKQRGGKACSKRATQAQRPVAPGERDEKAAQVGGSERGPPPTRGRGYSPRGTRSCRGRHKILCCGQFGEKKCWEEPQRGLAGSTWGAEGDAGGQQKHVPWGWEWGQGARSPFLPGAVGWMRRWSSVWMRWLADVFAACCLLVPFIDGVGRSNAFGASA